MSEPSLARGTYEMLQFPWMVFLLCSLTNQFRISRVIHVPLLISTNRHGCFSKLCSLLHRFRDHEFTVNDFCKMQSEHNKKASLNAVRMCLWWRLPDDNKIILNGCDRLLNQWTPSRPFQAPRRLAWKSCTGSVEVEERGGQSRRAENTPDSPLSSPKPGIARLRYRLWSPPPKP